MPETYPRIPCDVIPQFIQHLKIMKKRFEKLNVGAQVATLFRRVVALLRTAVSTLNSAMVGPDPDSLFQLAELLSQKHFGAQEPRDMSLRVVDDMARSIYQAYPELRPFANVFIVPQHKRFIGNLAEIRANRIQELITGRLKEFSKADLFLYSIISMAEDCAHLLEKIENPEVIDAALGEATPKLRKPKPAASDKTKVAVAAAAAAAKAPEEPSADDMLKEDKAFVAPSGTKLPGQETDEEGNREDNGEDNEEDNDVQVLDTAPIKKPKGKRKAKKQKGGQAKKKK